jgi:hypothetical protein
VNDKCQSIRPDPEAVERMRRQLGSYDMRQVAIWRRMTPAQRLAIVFQAYHLALQIVRKTEQDLHPELTPEEMQWRVVRRMHGDLSLGRDRKPQADD